MFSSQGTLLIVYLISLKHLSNLMLWIFHQLFHTFVLSILVKNLMYCFSLPVGMDNGPVGKELLYQCNSWSYKWELLSNNV